MNLFGWMRRPARESSWLQRYEREVTNSIWTRALLAWVESKDSIARPRGPTTSFLDAVETAAGLYALHAVIATGRTGPLRTPAVGAFGCHALEIVLMLARTEGVEPDADKAGGCFFQLMTAGLPSAEAQSFLGEAVSVWNRARDEAEAGNENMREWRSNLHTAVSGQLLAGIKDVPNLSQSNWKALLNDLGVRFVEYYNNVPGR